MLLPAAVLVGAWQHLARPSESTGKAAAMERTLRRGSGPDVVVVGSSLARTDVRIDVLADELGIDARDVALLTLPNATAAHVYAILENRVFGGGHAPRLILVVGALTTMVTPDVLLDASVERLVNQLSDDEPVLARKVFGADDPWRFRWLFRREQAGQLRDALLAAWRDVAIGGLVRGGRGAASRLAERADAVVFADERMDYALHRGTPTGLGVEAVEALDVSGVDVVHDSLLPDLTALAAAHGARLVFVRTPFPPSNADNDLVPPEVEAAARATIEAGGGELVDLRGLPLDDTSFRDMRHLTARGAEQLTHALVDALRRLGAVGGGDAVEGVGAASGVRSGELGGPSGAPVRVDPCTWRIPFPALAPLADDVLAPLGLRPSVRVTADGAPVAQRTSATTGCTPSYALRDGGVEVRGPTSAPRVAVTLAPWDDGDGVEGAWIAPGTSVRWQFDRPWSGPEQAFEVALVGHALGGSGPVDVRVDGRPVPVARQGDRVRVLARATPPVGAPWVLEVASPVDGPWLALAHVHVGRPPASVDLVGSPLALAGASIRAVGGKVEDTRLAPRFATPPPPIGAGLAPRAAGRGVAAFDLPGLAALADAPSPRDRNPHRCSPVQVLEDGVPLPAPEGTCDDMVRLGGGRTCHAGDAVLFTARDGSDPLANGRRYALALDPARLCDRRNQRDTTPLRGSLWLYPGDRARLELPPAELARFADGAARLEVAVDRLAAPAEATVRARLVVDGEVRLDAPLSGAGRRLWRELALDPPLPPRATDVAVELLNDDPEAWWLVTLVALSEAPPPVVAPPVAPAAAPRPPDRLARRGVGPTLPAPSRPRSLGGGTTELQLFPAWPVSTTALGRAGLGPWSPLVLRRGDEVLRPAGDREAFRGGSCAPCFLHEGKVVVVRDGPAPVAALAADVPLRTPDGAAVLWAYPGTSAMLGFDAPWVGDAVRVTARVTALGATTSATPRLRVAGVERPFVLADGAGEAVVTVPRPGAGAWEVEVVAPADGAWLVVREVVVEDGRGRATAWPRE